jgi:tetratricopeptide (TPR) repeat protein
MSGVRKPVNKLTKPATLFHNRGLARALLDDVDGAIADFTRALQDYPNLADAYNNRGFTYAKKGQLEAARSDLENALAINQNHPKARETLDKVVQMLKDRGGYPGRSPDVGLGSRGGSDAQTIELIGEWSVTSSGFSAVLYRFKADGSYEHSGTMESNLANTKVVLFETRTFSVQGDLLTLKRRSGTLVQNARREQLGSKTEAYRWRITSDPYTGGRVLWLTSSDGQQQQFYANTR